MEEVNKFCELLMLLHPPWEVRRWPVKKAAKRSRLAPVVKAAKTVWKHIEEILNAAVRGISNALSESINSKVQWIKRQACGYRSRKRFREAIYFHLGGLDLYPRPPFHSNP